MPKKVETYARPRSGKGLCAPVIDKSLLSKSKTGSMATFRAACHVLTCVAVYNGSAPKSAFASARVVFGVNKSRSSLAKATWRFFINIPLISDDTPHAFFNESVFFGIQDLPLVDVGGGGRETSQGNRCGCW